MPAYKIWLFLTLQKDKKNICRNHYDELKKEVKNNMLGKQSKIFIMPRIAHVEELWTKLIKTNFFFAISV